MYVLIHDMTLAYIQLLYIICTYLLVYSIIILASPYIFNTVAHKYQHKITNTCMQCVVF